MVDTWTVQRVLNWTVEYFTSKNISEPRLSAELLLAHLLNSKRIELYLQFERLLTPAELAAYRSSIQRRAQGEPVQYILGETEFMGMLFKVSPAVLIPRPDTELLVDCTIEYLKAANIAHPRILDIGCGCGCIAISLAKFFPEAEVWAVEKSTEAFAIAEENARLNEVNIQFVNNDFFDYYAGLDTKFNSIVTNPPYVSDKDWEELQLEVRQFEPRQALWGGADGLEFYRRFTPLFAKILEAKGVAMMETGYDQAQAVSAMLMQQNFSVEIRKDYRQIERVVIAQKIE